MLLWLDIFWLMLAAGTLGHWQWSRAARRGCTTRAQRLLTLVGVFVLLFPIVSARDDLLEQQYLAEKPDDAGSAVSDTAHHSAWAPGERVAQPAILRPMAFAWPGVTVGRVGEVATVTPASALVRPGEGRAPPSSHS